MTRGKENKSTIIIYQVKVVSDPLGGKVLVVEKSRYTFLFPSVTYTHASNTCHKSIVDFINLLDRPNKHPINRQVYCDSCANDSRGRKSYTAEIVYPSDERDGLREHI